MKSFFRIYVRPNLVLALVFVGAFFAWFNFMPYDVFLKEKIEPNMEAGIICLNFSTTLLFIHFSLRSDIREVKRIEEQVAKDKEKILSSVYLLKYQAEQSSGIMINWIQRWRDREQCDSGTFQFELQKLKENYISEKRIVDLIMDENIGIFSITRDEIVNLYKENELLRNRFLKEISKRDMPYGSYESKLEECFVRTYNINEAIESKIIKFIGKYMDEFNNNYEKLNNLYKQIES